MRRDRVLFPDVEPDTGVVYDDVEKKEIAEDTGNKSRKNDIYDTIALPFSLIERTYPLPTEVEKNASC